MALLAGLPKSPAFPSGRYTRTNPLRREAGLRLLTEHLPEPLRCLLIRAWRRPARFDGNEAIQNPHRQRPDEAQLFSMPLRLLGWFVVMELEVSRRVVEAPQASILPVTRNNLLIGQGFYLRSLHLALARQMGEAAALAEFERLIAGMG